MKAHPDAVAYVGPGTQAAVSLSRIQRKPRAKKLLVGACDLDQVALEGVKDGYVEALISPEHWLKGYLAVKLMADAKQSGKPLPEGMWNSGALTVNDDNIDEIIARQKDAASRAGVLQGRGRQAARQPGPVPRADADRLSARGPRPHEVLRRRRRARRRGLHGPRRRRCTRCWARTARASRRW